MLRKWEPITPLSREGNKGDATASERYSFPMRTSAPTQPFHTEHDHIRCFGSDRTVGSFELRMVQVDRFGEVGQFAWLVLRPDDPRPSWPAERVLADAPDVAAGGFRVPTPGR